MILVSYNWHLKMKMDNLLQIKRQYYYLFSWIKSMLKRVSKLLWDKTYDLKQIDILLNPIQNKVDSLTRYQFTMIDVSVKKLLPFLLVRKCVRCSMIDKAMQNEISTEIYELFHLKLSYVVYQTWICRLKFIWNTWR